MLGRCRSWLGSLPAQLLLAGVSLGLWFGFDPHAEHEPARPRSAGVGYGPALWRLAPQQLNGVLMAVQHVLVCHAGSRGDGALFIPEPERPCVRSLADAERLALDLSARAIAQPAAFDELARRYSDDAATATHGGHLGLRRATELPDEMLDALAQLEIGQVSRPFATSYGYHLVRRLELPATAQVSIEELLLKYEGAEGPARPGAPRRSREEARRRGLELAALLAADPGRFAEVVASESDAYDRSEAGDAGTWSTREASPYPLELRVLATLREGQVAGPFDSRDGFRIVRRGAPRARMELGVSAVTLPVTGSPEEMASARERALALAAELAGEPAAWEQILRARCAELGCRPVQYRFFSGRELDVWEAALRVLPVGGVVPTPVEGPLGFSVLRREDPAALPAPQEPRFELPTPAPRSLAFFVERLPSYPLAYATSRLADDMRERLALAGATRSQYESIMSRLVERFRAGEASDRQQALSSARTDLLGLLGQDRLHVLDREIESWILSAQLGVL
jgi:hypothetical protein